MRRAVERTADRRAPRRSAGRRRRVDRDTRRATGRTICVGAWPRSRRSATIAADGGRRDRQSARARRARRRRSSASSRTSCFIEEPRPGLSYARNAGFAAATGDILIAIDDDVTVPAGWLERLVAPFARPEVMAVTGHVLPIELETESQCRFEAYGGLGKGFTALRGERRMVPHAARRGPDLESRRDRQRRVPRHDFQRPAHRHARRGARRRHADRLQRRHVPLLPDPESGPHDRLRAVARGSGIVIAATTRALRHQIHCYSKGHVAYHLTTLLRDGDRARARPARLLAAEGVPAKRA